MDNINNNQITVPHLLTVKQFISTFPAFSYGSIRGYIFYEDSNGMKENKVIKRIGGKVLVDVEAFFQWVDIKTTEGNR